ncbi:MAG: hypothetical protein ABJD11_16315 [Gemmatimonadota bacterium]
MQHLLTCGGIVLAGLLGHLSLDDGRNSSSRAMERVSLWGGILLALVAVSR